MGEIRVILEDIYGAWGEQNLERLATYLPNEFCHIINFPPQLHHLGGTCQGKRAALERFGKIFSEFEFVWLDTSGLMVHNDRAAVQIPAVCRHRETGVLLQTVRAHFWTIEAGWPVTLNEYFDLSHVKDFVSAVAAQASA